MFMRLWISCSDPLFHQLREPNPNPKSETTPRGLCVSLTRVRTTLHYATLTPHTSLVPQASKGRSTSRIPFSNSSHLRHLYSPCLISFEVLQPLEVSLSRTPNLPWPRDGASCPTVILAPSSGERVGNGGQNGASGRGKLRSQPRW